MDLRRRRYLTTFGATAGALTLAGCSGDGDDGENDDEDEGSGDDDSTTEAAADTEPQYDTGANTELLLSLDAFPDGWVRDDSLNENFDAVFRNEDGSIVVLTTAEIFDTVAGAETGWRPHGRA
ncbi:hypothetical protein [Halapricum sp. CBA1109]|uniref:hypothetical protein n=1 Tax=Halapricum sp. CBA1109 TaxID=2668068 RepID=UPI0018D258CB|nr:hypothetical protein [Halapricum sp. CBA1109]